MDRPRRPRLLRVAGWALTVVLAAAAGFAAFAAWRRLHHQRIPLFEGAHGEYALSYVDDRGRYLSKQRGGLRLVDDPFTSYRNLPDQRSAEINIDHDGLRGPPIADGRSRIALLGGSAAFGFGLPSDDRTVAARLQKLEPGYRVLNAAVVGFYSGQELALMVHRLDRLRPAVYVVLDGWNDLAGLLLSTKRLVPDRFGFNAAFSTELEDELAKHQEQPSAEARKARELDLETFVDGARREYWDNLDRMNRFARASGARLLVVFQPELGRKQTRTPLEEKQLAEWDHTLEYRRRAISERHRALGEATERFCHEKGIEFYDLSADPLFVDEPNALFNDVVHPNERGHELMAELIHRRLAALPR